MSSPLKPLITSLRLLPMRKSLSSVPLKVGSTEFGPGIKLIAGRVICSQMQSRSSGVPVGVGVGVGVPVGVGVGVGVPVGVGVGVPVGGGGGVPVGGGGGGG